MNSPRSLLLFALLIGTAFSVQAQISVDVNIKRRTFIRHEPIVATVSITNLAGRDLMLSDDKGPQWFGFQITTGKDIIPPRNPDYRLDPLEVKAGSTVKRTVNLNELFSLSEYGVYHIKAAIYSGQLDKYFSSRAEKVEVREGRSIWQQTVGVPEGMPNGGDMHTYSLLAFQGGDRLQLYCRVEDRVNGAVFCTYKVCDLIEGQVPETQLDAANNLYVLTVAGPKMYLLTKIGVNGDFLGQTSYTSGKKRPFLRRLADGNLQIVGGRREVAQNTAPGEPVAVPAAKLSDRPVGLPAN